MFSNFFLNWSFFGEKKTNSKNPPKKRIWCSEWENIHWNLFSGAFNRLWSSYFRKFLCKMNERFGAQCGGLWVHLFIYLFLVPPGFIGPGDKGACALQSLGLKPIIYCFQGPAVTFIVPSMEFGHSFQKTHSWSQNAAHPQYKHQNASTPDRFYGGICIKIWPIVLGTTEKSSLT